MAASALLHLDLDVNLGVLNRHLIARDPDVERRDASVGIDAALPVLDPHLDIFVVDQLVIRSVVDRNRACNKAFADATHRDFPANLKLEWWPPEWSDVVGFEADFFGKEAPV